MQSREMVQDERDAVGRQKKIQVLIVEDHELVRSGVRALVEHEPDITIVAEAATGGQALSLARRLQPDVVLLDARLPDMPGPQVCRALDEVAPAAAVAILTTFADESLVRECVAAGAQGYLLKDVSRLNLAENIRALARGDPVIDRSVLPIVLAAARQGSSFSDADRPLNDRQRLILQLIADGLSNREIAARANLSELTVKSYIEELLKRIGARNRVHAAILAERKGWLSAGDVGVS
jgi:DNA-binding NarL/FixJ family response regulator